MTAVIVICVFLGILLLIVYTLFYLMRTTEKIMKDMATATKEISDCQMAIVDLRQKQAIAESDINRHEETINQMFPVYAKYQNKEVVGKHARVD